uniref:Uncharacterized protein n=1 Tax=Ditylenchus dipsaci TaxID=166011 RepID=A0A915CTX7_9BILA
MKFYNSSLQEAENNVDDEEKSSRTSSADSTTNQETDMPCSPLKSDPTFTQEELEHIERIRRSAEESSFEQTKVYDSSLPSAIEAQNAEVFSKVSDSDYVVEGQKTEEVHLYTDTKSSLAQDDQQIYTGDQVDLTQEELEHIDRIRRMAEESSFEYPVLVAEIKFDDEDHSSRTSSADSIASDQINQQTDKSCSPRQASYSSSLAQEELDHIEMVRSLTEESSNTAFYGLPAAVDEPKSSESPCSAEHQEQTNQILLLRLQSCFRLLQTIKSC